MVPGSRLGLTGKNVYKFVKINTGLVPGPLRSGAEGERRRADGKVVFSVRRCTAPLTRSQRRHGSELVAPFVSIVVTRICIPQIAR